MRKENKKKFNKGGRPRKVVKKTKRISIACALSDLKVVQYKAKEHQLKISQYGLKLMLEEPLPKKISIELMNEIRILTNMSNNLNQLTKITHINGSVGLELLNTLEKLSMYINRLKHDW